MKWHKESLINQGKVGVQDKRSSTSGDDQQPIIEHTKKKFWNIKRSD